MNKRIKSSIPVGTFLYRTALVLVCLVMLSFHLMSGLFAKYSVTGHASDSARVAKFDVAITGPAMNAVEIVCASMDNQSGVYQLEVHNASEVAVSYQLNVLMDSTPGVIYTLTPETGTIAPGATANVTLTFTVDWAKFTENAVGDSYTVKHKFTVNAHIEQIN